MNARARIGSALSRMSTRARAVPPVLLFAALTELGLRTLPLGVVCRGFGIRIGRERGLAPAL